MAVIKGRNGWRWGLSTTCSGLGLPRCDLSPAIWYKKAVIPSDSKTMSGECCEQKLVICEAPIYNKINFF